MKNNKNIKKILGLILIIVLSLLIYKIIKIYALFQNEINGNVKFINGAWNIIVNGTEITKGTETNFVINNVKIGQDKHVKPGTIAPGLSGNFEIEINPKDTDVSIRYDISLPQSDLKVKIKEVKEITEEKQLIKTAPDVYTGIIPLEKIKAGGISRINVAIEWINEEINNEQDTQMGKNPTHKFEIPITVHFEQYLGETITPLE